MNCSRVLLIVASALACAGPVLAQVPDSNGVTVWIAPASGQQPIRLDSVDIKIDTSGFIARTRIEMSFHNPNGRVMEGEFVFPLAAGQTVAGYALEVEGKLREGVVVPKQTARVAFEDITRQNVDPGLAELTAGNVFRTRLYPIPANGNKRIALSIEQVMVDGGAHYQYLLPLAFRQPVSRFTLRAEALAAASSPSDASASPDQALSFDRSGNAWVASFARNDVMPQRELAFRIPKGKGELSVLEAAESLEPRWRSVVAQIDTGLPAQRVAPTKPRRIGLFFDASGSAAERDLARERAVIGSYLNALGAVEVQLVVFRDAAESRKTFKLSPGQSQELLAALAELPLDGGSSYAAIDGDLLSDVDVVLVIGDGLSNFGGAVPRLKAGVPIHVLHAAQKADHAALARIAESAGGQVIDLLQVNAEQATKTLHSAAWRLLSADVTGGSCADMLPAIGAAVTQTTVITARCDGKAKLTLRFGESTNAAITREFNVGEREPVATALTDSVHRLRAQATIAALQTQTPTDETAITELGTRFGVVTRYTSLLVLDRLEDYLRYRIEPKDADLAALYRARLASLPKVVADAGQDARVAALAAAWHEFRSWHKTRHPWLETLLLPTAEAEALQWANLNRANDWPKPDHPQQSDVVSKQIRAAARDAARLSKHSQALVARWANEGADAASRRLWEREAGLLMVEVDRLRTQRLKLPTAALSIAAQPGDDAVADGAGADRVAVTGSPTREDAPEPPRARRLEEVELRAPPVVAAPPAPSAPVAAEAMAGRAADSDQESAKLIDGIASDTQTEPAPGRIQLAGWNPDTPYLDAIRGASDPYQAYLTQRKAHGTAPAFFIDVADFLRDQAKQPALAQRVLSNIAELDSENTALTRVLAYRLAQWGDYALAVGQFESALQQRPEEPQSYRDLALALARQSTPDIARAVQLLWKVASGEWHGRFPGIEVIALHEINDLLATDASGPNGLRAVQALGIPMGLLDGLSLGLRVSMSWDADNSDIDLWVTDPSGEETYYGQNRSKSGGHVSNDFTQGYGPEVYSIARPLPGTYRVRAHYFGDRRQSLTGPVTVQIEFETEFGKNGGSREAITRRLESSGNEWVELGEFSVGVAE
ncbi:MAG: VIT domain-containing protein [Pseudomarimonas sp.]